MTTAQLAPVLVVVLAGHVIAGALVSTTVMTCTHVLRLAHASVAVHVRAIVRSCGQRPGDTASE